MWSRRGIVRSVVLAGAFAALAGCGFQPLYGRASTPSANTGASVDNQMAAIRIQPIANRQGQQLHNALRDRFNPLGQPSGGGYSLDVSLTVRAYGALSKRDLSATRRNVEMNAFYSLTDLSGTVVMTDRSTITTGYDEFDDPFNDISAYEDTLRRNTFQIADQIRTRVAVFLTAGTPPAVVPTATVPAPAPTPASTAAPTSGILAPSDSSKTSTP